MMNKTMRGTVHGRTIQLDDDPGIEDGRQVEIVLHVSQLPGPPPRWNSESTGTAAGMMSEHWTEQDDEILEQIHQDRKQDHRREPV